MLLDKREVMDILRCPRTGSPLRLRDDRLVAETGAGRIEYELHAGFPVLVDFANSVLQKEKTRTLASVIHRRSYRGITGVLKRFVSPPKQATADNVQHLLRLLFESTGKARVLMIGGGTIGQGMEPFYDDPRIDLVAFDIYAAPTVQFVADAHNIPLPDASFDAVIIQAVLEHVLEPAAVVAEIHRVLKHDGIVYAETPFLQHVHEGAYDFTRYTDSGHRYLFKDFALVKSGASAGAGTQLLWALDIFFRGLCRSRTIGKALKLACFWLRHCDRLIPAAYNVDAASGVFFLGRKQASPISPAEAIAHYQGAQR